MEANNMAAMRKALVQVSRIAVEMTRKTITGEPEDRKTVDRWALRLCDIACDAISAPPRNCDIYTDIDSAFRACQEDRGYLKSPIDERRSVISFMLSTNTSGEANKDEGEPDESK